MKNKRVIISFVFLSVFLLVCLYGFFGGEDSPSSLVEQPLCYYFVSESHGVECADQSVWPSLVNDRGVDQISLRSAFVWNVGNAVAGSKKLLALGFVPPGRDVKPWPFHLPLEWNADPFHDTNWRYQLHAWRMLDSLLIAWDETREVRYLEESLKIIFDWYDYHVVRGLVSDYGWYDMSVGLRAMKLAYVLERAFKKDIQLNDEQQRRIVHLAWLHADKLMDKRLLAEGNHGLFQLHGVLALCKVLPSIASCKGYQKYVAREMQQLLLRQFSFEGVHLESSPEYHFFAYRTVKKFMDSGWYQGFDFLRELMSKVEQNQVWMVHPDKKVVTIGDSESKEIKINWPKSRAGCSGFMHLNCYQLKNFKGSGYAIVRSDWSAPVQESSMLFFMGMFFQTAHKQPDDLSFEWFERGERVLTNSGKYSYSSGRFRDYVMSSAAHSVVEVDGESYDISRSAQYGSAIKDAKQDGDVFFIQGGVSHIKLAVDHRRTLLFHPGRWLAVIDDLSAQKRRMFRQWFHFAPQWHLQEGMLQPLKLVSDSGQTLWVEHLSAGEIHTARGQLEPRPQGWVTESYGKMMARQALGFSVSGDKVQMVTILGFGQQELEKARQSVAEYIDD